MASSVSWGRGLEGGDACQFCSVTPPRVVASSSATLPREGEIMVAIGEKCRALE
jgi:hypothetical protein